MTYAEYLRQLISQSDGLDIKKDRKGVEAHLWKIVSVHQILQDDAEMAEEQTDDSYLAEVEEEINSSDNFSEFLADHTDGDSV